MISAPRSVRIGLTLLLVLFVSFTTGAAASGHVDIAEWPARAAVATLVTLIFAVGERWWKE